MSACQECGRCPCYDHERRTVCFEDEPTLPSRVLGEIPPPPRVPVIEYWPTRPSVGGPVILMVLGAFIGFVLACVYLSLL